MLIFLIIVGVGSLCVSHGHPLCQPRCLILERYHRRAALFSSINSYDFPRLIIQAICQYTSILAGRILIYIHYSPYLRLASLRNEPCMSSLP